VYRLTRNAAACDGPSCDAWSREPEDHGFLELRMRGQFLLFCSPECAMRLLMEQEPTQILSS